MKNGWAVVMITVVVIPYKEPATQRMFLMFRWWRWMAFTRNATIAGGIEEDVGRVVGRAMRGRTVKRDE